MSKFQPIDEAEYKARNIWPAGWYAAEISECIEKMSQAGNLMFQTTFQVFNNEGKMRLVIAYIIAEGAAAWQLRSCAEAFGVLDEYRAGNLTEDDLKGKSGYVKLGIEKGKRKDGGDESEKVSDEERWPDKQVIRDYKNTMPGTVSAKDVEKKKPLTKKELEETLGESEIPF